MTQKRRLTQKQRDQAYDMWVNRGFNDREVAEAMGWSNTKAYEIRRYVLGIKACGKWGAGKKKSDQASGTE